MNTIVNTQHTPPALNVRYTHTVWGVDINEHPLVAVNGRKHFSSAPVPVFKKVHRQITVEVK